MTVAAEHERPDIRDSVALLEPNDTFPRRHVGPDGPERRHMLDLLGVDSLDELMHEAVPESIRLAGDMNLPGTGLTESAAIDRLREIASKNTRRRSLIGQGYAGTITPPVILRNVLENPGWYTAYTPYQAEISQGRLEALLVFQQMISDLTGLPLANSSLLDEATAAAEAMAMAKGIAGAQKSNTFVLLDAGCHPQTIGVVTTRARSHGHRRPGRRRSRRRPTSATTVFGVLVQYPATERAVSSRLPRPSPRSVHDNGRLARGRGNRHSRAVPC